MSTALRNTLTSRYISSQRALVRAHAHTHTHTHTQSVVNTDFIIRSVRRSVGLHVLVFCSIFSSYWFIKNVPKNNYRCISGI